MKRQKVDVPMAVDSSESGQDSGHLVNQLMRVTKYMTRHLATLRVSLELPLFTPTFLNFITLTFRAPSRSHIVSTPLEAIAMLCFSMNSGIASSVPVLSWFSVQGKLRKKMSCPSKVTKREYIRHREASSSFRAAQISRQGCLNPIIGAPARRRSGLCHLGTLFFVTGWEVARRMTQKFSAKHVKVVAFLYCRAIQSCHNVRSSRPSGNLPTQGLDDLTLWPDEWPNKREAQQLSHVSLIKSWKDGQEWNSESDERRGVEEGKWARDKFS